MSLAQAPSQVPLAQAPSRELSVPFSPAFIALTLEITEFIRSSINTDNNLISSDNALASINAVIDNIHLFSNEYYAVNQQCKIKIINLLSILYKKARDFSNTTKCSTHARLFKNQAKFIAYTLDSLGYSTNKTLLRRSKRINSH